MCYHFFILNYEFLMKLLQSPLNWKFLDLRSANSKLFEVELFSLGSEESSVILRKILILLEKIFYKMLENRANPIIDYTISERNFHAKSDQISLFHTCCRYPFLLNRSVLKIKESSKENYSHKKICCTL